MRAAKVPSHTLAAELLLIHALGRDRTWLYTHPRQSARAAAVEKYFALVARRAAGEPTQYLTGKQEFWGLEFEVTPAVLIPRPETEHVVEVALGAAGPAWHQNSHGHRRAQSAVCASRMSAPVPAASPWRWRTNCRTRTCSRPTFPRRRLQWRREMPRAIECGRSRAFGRDESARCLSWTRPRAAAKRARFRRDREQSSLCRA